LVVRACGTAKQAVSLTKSFEAGATGKQLRRRASQDIVVTAVARDEDRLHLREHRYMW
jgi:hypothetical protein